MRCEYGSEDERVKGVRVVVVAYEVWREVWEEKEEK